MKIIFLIHELNAPSHVWAQRMISHLKRDICAIATTKTKDLQFDNLPIIDLSRGDSFFRRIKKRVNLINETDQQRTNKILIQAIETYKPNILFINFAHLALYYEETLKQYKGKIVIHCHGADVSWDIRKHESPDQLIYPQNYTSSIRDLSQRAFFIANSKFTQERLYEIGVQASKVKLKYFGIDVIDDNSTPKPHSECLKIIFVGRLIDCKGPDLVIKAFIEACDQGMKAEFFIVGDGPMMITCQLLKLQSQYSDRIHLLGALKFAEVQKLLINSDIYTAHHCKGLLTHQEEAFGVSILEAMAYGLPVITGRSGGPQEIVVHNNTGFLVEQFDVKEHATYFIEYYKNEKLRRLHGENGKKRVIENFNVLQELLEYNNIFNHL